MLSLLESVDFCGLRICLIYSSICTNKIFKFPKQSFTKLIYFIGAEI